MWVRGNRALLRVDPVTSDLAQHRGQKQIAQGVFRKIEGDPELKQSLEALVKDLPEDRRQNALVKMGSKALRDIGLFKSRTQQQGGVSIRPARRGG